MYNVLWDNKQLTNVTAFPVPYGGITISAGTGFTLKNNSIYQVNVYGAGGVLLQSIDPFYQFGYNSTDAIVLYVQIAGVSESLPDSTYQQSISITTGDSVQGGLSKLSVTQVNNPLDVNIQNSSIEVTGNVEANVSGSVDANITNASLDVTGNVDATIQNATLNVAPADGVTFDVAGSVDITNTSIAVTNTSGGNLTVAGTVDANITNASLDVSGSVDATIQNASINVAPVSGSANFPIEGNVNATIQNATIEVAPASSSANFPIAGNVDATIQNATLNVAPADGVTFDVAGTVTFPSAQDVNLSANNAGTLSVEFPSAQDVNVNNTSIAVTNASGGSLTVAGTVDATIQNASIDTQSTVINEQLVQGMNESGIVPISIPTSDSGGTYTTNTVQVLPKGQSISSLQIDVFLSKTVVDTLTDAICNVFVGMTFGDGTQALIGNIGSFSVIVPEGQSTSAQYLYWNVQIAPNYDGMPVAFNYVQFQFESLPTLSATLNGNIRWVAHGQAMPNATTDNYPTTARLAFSMPGSLNVTGMDNGVPLPIQYYEWNGVSGGYHIDKPAVQVVGGGSVTTSIAYPTSLGNDRFQYIHIRAVNLSTSYDDSIVVGFSDGSSSITYTWNVLGATTNAANKTNVQNVDLVFPRPVLPFGEGVKLSVGAWSTNTNNSGNIHATVIVQ